MISRVAGGDNCRRLDHEDDAFFGCPRAMHHALGDDKSLIGQKLDRSPLEIDYESAAQDVEKLIIIVVFVPVVLALQYAEPHDGIVHPAKRLIVPLVGDRLCELIDIDQSEGGRTLRRDTSCRKRLSVLPSSVSYCPLQIDARAKLQSPVLEHVLTTGGRPARRRKEERMIALDFRCDEGRNLPDMR